MTKARIYQPDKNAMQSGKAKTDSWMLEFVPETPYFTEGFMGWDGMNGTAREIRLQFPSKEAAISYAKKEQLEFEVYDPNKRNQKIKNYADNFSYNKIRA